MPASKTALRDALTNCAEQLAAALGFLTAWHAADSLAVPADLHEELEQIRHGWIGLVDIDFELDPGANEVSRRSQTLMHAVVRIVGEAVSNATIHGSARHIRVRITEDQGCIAIHVTDDGTGLSKGAATGSGSTTYSQARARWSIEPNDGTSGWKNGCTLTARLPCGGGNADA